MAGALKFAIATVLVLAPLGASSRAATSEAQPTSKSAAPKAVAYKAPRTAFGQPDLMGYWSNSTLTPLSRKPAFGLQPGTEYRSFSGKYSVLQHQRRVHNQLRHVRQCIRQSEPGGSEG